jgi:hypothetical protein
MDEGEDIYVMTGYHTVLDAHIIEQLGEARGFGGKLVIPLSTALAATGVVVPFGDLTDPRLAGISNWRTEHQRKQYMAQGEQIIAVQYRKVCFSFFSSKSVDKATLAKGTRWERYDRPRYLQSDWEDMVEAGLEDELPVEGNREKCIVGSSEIIFLAAKLSIEQ